MNHVEKVFDNWFFFIIFSFDIDYSEVVKSIRIEDKNSELPIIWTPIINRETDGTTHRMVKVLSIPPKC